jgi:hypothetical protein
VAAPGEAKSVVRLLIHVEGQTEETFVNAVLAEHLYSLGYGYVSARLLGNSRNRTHRGGIRAWETVRSEIIRHLKGDQNCLATMMVDYYALPSTWPGRESCEHLSSIQKAARVEAAIHADIRQQIGDSFNPERFVPYVMMYEFEGLLFSDCESFCQTIGRVDLTNELQAIRKQFETPEEINDSPDTAPSKRLQAIIPGYQKSVMGTLAIQEMGLDIIRAECPNFRQWLERLEALPQKLGNEIQN